MASINDILYPPVDHSCSHCNKRFLQQHNLLRYIKCQHADKILDEKLEYQLCHAKFKRIDNLTFYKCTCEYWKIGKQVATNQIGGSAPKRQRNNHAKWSEQLL